MLIKIKAWDINCPQHITPRYTKEEIAPQLMALRDKVAALEAELRALKGD